MGILEFAEPIIVICTRDRTRAAAFYRETLGLVMTSEDNLAAVFNVGGIALRLSTVADFIPREHTILGFNVPDVIATVKALHEKNITFTRYNGFSQDELGIVAIPGTAVRIAWFTDPDSNVLSVTNA